MQSQPATQPPTRRAVQRSQGHKFNLDRSAPLTRKNFIKKFGHRIRDSPTTMDPDQIFRALDANRDGSVESEELKGFRTLCVPRDP